PFLVTPGSDQIYETIKRDEFVGALESVGAVVMANACGPCIGQWKRDDPSPGEQNSIITSFNRNFPARNDGNPGTLAFIGSPETVVALALAGRIDFDFVHDTLSANGGSPSGASLRLEPPVAPDLPEAGFDPGVSGFVEPATDPDSVIVEVRADSDRLQLLEPFPAWDGADITGLRVLLKAAGKCTTDHISPAGPWLRYRGHLDNISGNLFIGANNAFTPGRSGQGVDARDGSTSPLPDLARAYRDAGVSWLAVGDENYGEGSSREHAAMEPRFLGGRAVLVRSFARIHEANLKKQGVLALTFADPGDYDKVRVDDVVDILGVSGLAPGSTVTVVLRHADATTDEIMATHTMSDEHIAWFKAGSALNLLRDQRAR
ncbi:MAG TPA: aconitase family protein, partial [Acidimicrobiia bacterium]|nr:aconitase family protein [Acidimicrobiia bacterium]